MFKRLRNWLGEAICDWLNAQRPPRLNPLCDFQRISYELKPADILLVEGRSRVSNIIKQVTHSPWTHAAIYIGRIYDIEGDGLRQIVRRFYDGPPDQQLLIESMLGSGTIVTPLHHYHEDHIRICRPTHLSPSDARRVIRYVIQRLGYQYDVRQLFDMARFFLPYPLIPKRWRTTLFEHHAGRHTRTVCSTLLADAFASVHYPILPFINRDAQGETRFYRRSPKLFAPRDFDYSPYFDVIKYPYLELNEIELYRRLPWDDSGKICDDEGVCYGPDPNQKQDAGGKVFGFVRTKEGVKEENTI